MASAEEPMADDVRSESALGAGARIKRWRDESVSKGGREEK